MKDSHMIIRFIDTESGLHGNVTLWKFNFWKVFSILAFLSPNAGSKSPANTHPALFAYFLSTAASDLSTTPYSSSSNLAATCSTLDWE